MKGMIFTEFMDMVEEAFGLEMADLLIDETQPSSGGAYTSVGTYPLEELVAMLQVLSRESKTPIPQLLTAYGKRLFAKLGSAHPAIMAHVSDPLDFLESIEHTIHVEVRKLYPDAELPTFEIERKSPDILEMRYRSSRHLEDLAEGLIHGCLAYFEVPATVAREAQADSSVLFRIERSAE
jgi:hypothetical protein